MKQAGMYFFVYFAHGNWKFSIHQGIRQVGVEVNQGSPCVFIFIIFVCIMAAAPNAHKQIEYAAQEVLLGSVDMRHA